MIEIIIKVFGIDIKFELCINKVVIVIDFKILENRRIKERWWLMFIEF